MGHIRLGSLPATRKWNKLVELIAGGAAADRVAEATITAAEKWFHAAAEDTGVVETVRVLMELPFAARTDDFPSALGECGVEVSPAPGLVEVVAGITEAIDRAMPNCRGRTDLGEMAQMAAAETVAEVVGNRVNGLFGTDPGEVQREFGRLATSKQFGDFAEQFFARFTFKVLDFFLSKTLPAQVGEGKRFPTLAHQAEFTRQLDTHCRETARITAEYSGDWLMKHRWEDGEVTRHGAAAFTSYAMTKLTDELRRRANP